MELSRPTKYFPTKAYSQRQRFRTKTFSNCFISLSQLKELPSTITYISFYCELANYSSQPSTVHQLSSPIFPCLLPLTLAHSGALWLTLTHSGSLQLTLALSGTHFLTRPLLGLLHRSCIAPVYPPLLLVYAIGQFLPV